MIEIKRIKLISVIATVRKTADYALVGGSSLPSAASGGARVNSPGGYIRRTPTLSAACSGGAGR